MDIQLSCFESFKRHGTDTAIRAMTANAVIINFNIFKHGMAHLFTGAKVFTVDGLYLHGVKETLSTGSSSAAESHRYALTEPYVNLSIHTALVIQP